MRKLKNKILKKLNNTGSSIVMVIVALGFIGIIVAALLSTAAYAYRLKLQDINSKDNYYYVEQAMNEIYAGVGSQTMQDMQNAYVYTVEHMVYYDLGANGGNGGYETLSDEKATQMFKDKFLENLKTNTFFDKDKLPNSLQALITNESVVLDKSKLTIIEDKKGITLKNVTLNRTADYDKSTARGTYTQTISADIIIGEPDFMIKFNTAASAYENIFNYALVADMGVEINQVSTPLNITGNIYAASDYYNKTYNDSRYDIGVSDDSKVPTKQVYGTKDVDEEKYDYVHGSVTSRIIEKEAGKIKTNTFYNPYSTTTAKESSDDADYFDGVNSRSSASGLYIDNSSVSIMADTIVVPGTIAVMNTGNLSIFGKEGKNTSEAEVWTDNVLLGGYSKKVKDEKNKESYVGSAAIVRANLFVKDDTELNAQGANFQLKGSYYGYGDSTEKDKRIFLPTVDSENFQIETKDGKKENRGHYNSSAIIVNGENSVLDFSSTYSIFLAGRSYIELSKHVENEEYALDADGKVVDIGTKDSTEYVRQTYEYTPTTTSIENEKETVYVRDYKTGESVSLKSNQVAYIPVLASSAPVKSAKGNYYIAELPVYLSGLDLFTEHFPTTGEFASTGGKAKVPCIVQNVSGKRYYYYDFQTAYDNLSAAEKATYKYKSGQDLAADFIADYVAYYQELLEIDEEDLTDNEKKIKAALTDLGNYEDFDFKDGTITLPDATLDNVNIYSSGAITTKTNTEFEMITKNDTQVIDKLLSKYKDGPGTTPGDLDLAAYKYSNSLEQEYEYVKWNLGHFANDATYEKTYLKDMLAEDNLSESDLTPLNRFLYMRRLTTNISPDASEDLEATDNDKVLTLTSGYRVWMWSGLDKNGKAKDLTITAGPKDKGRVRGIVVTRGDVYFDKDVTSFEGLIVSGGKIYVTENVTNISSSAELCRRILEECQLSKDEEAKDLLKLFRGYEDFIDSGDDSSEDVRTIDTIDYSDVVSFDNWMKNAE